MYKDIMERRSVLLKLKSTPNMAGRASVQLGDGINVKYNWNDKDTLVDIMSRHADEHDGKLLIPFNTIASVKSMRLCSRFIFWSDGDTYISGRIHDVGEDYRPGMSDGAYTTPVQMRVNEASRWVKIDDAMAGRGFPVDHYMMVATKTGRPTELKNVLKRSRMVCMFIIEKEQKEGTVE